MKDKKQDSTARITNSKPIPHIPLAFKEVIADVFKVKPPEKPPSKNRNRKKIATVSSQARSRSSMFHRSFLLVRSPNNSRPDLR